MKEAGAGWSARSPKPAGRRRKERTNPPERATRPELRAEGGARSWRRVDAGLDASDAPPRRDIVSLESRSVPLRFTPGSLLCVPPALLPEGPSPVHTLGRDSGLPGSEIRVAGAPHPSLVRSSWQPVGSIFLLGGNKSVQNRLFKSLVPGGNGLISGGFRTPP